MGPFPEFKVTTYRHKDCPNDHSSQSPSLQQTVLYGDGATPPTSIRYTCGCGFDMTIRDDPHYGWDTGKA